jgi:uncharacterized metal-binding protein YceD (DUF177 family)
MTSNTLEDEQYTGSQALAEYKIALQTMLRCPKCLQEFKQKVSALSKHQLDSSQNNSEALSYYDSRTIRRS